MNQPCISLCPYCGVALGKMPSRKTGCKSCGKPIYVRQLEGHTTSLLLTESQVNGFDAERSKKYEKLHADKRIHELLDELSAPKGSNPARIRAEIARYDRLKDWGKKKAIANNLAHAFHAENLNPQHWLIEAATCELRQLAQMPTWHNHLFVSNGCGHVGSSCAALEGKKFTLNEALAEMPIPNVHCENDRNTAGFARCQCTWMIDLDAVAKAREIESRDQRQAAKERLAAIGIVVGARAPEPPKSQSLISRLVQWFRQEI